MERTSKPRAKKTNSARADAIYHAQIVNKELPTEWLEQKTNQELICFVHPSDRKRVSENLGVIIY